MKGTKFHSVGSTNTTRCPFQGPVMELGNSVSFIRALRSAVRSIDVRAILPILSVSGLHEAGPSVGMSPIVVLTP